MTARSVLSSAAVLLWTVQTFGQGAGDTILLSSQAVGGMGKAWQIGLAGITETEHGVRVDVRIRNITNRPIANAQFYGEIADALGRRCLTTVFDLMENQENVQAPVLPEEVRTLTTFSSGLAPSSTPASLAMSLLDIEPAGPNSAP